jgi:hypothetical protein
VSLLYAGNKYYKLTSSGIAPGYPRYIASDFLGVPANIDAAVFFASSRPGDPSRTYLFKVTHTLDLSCHICAIQNAEMKTKIIMKLCCLLQNNLFWRIENFVVRTVLLIKLGFPGIPDDITAAFTRATNGDVYFIKGGNNWLFNY